MNQYRDFDALQDWEKWQYIYDWKPHLKPFGRDDTVNIFLLKDDLMNESVYESINDRAALGFARLCLIGVGVQNLFAFKLGAHFHATI